jgi:transcriptional regulator with XRE-family HTH domain
MEGGMTVRHREPGPLARHISHLRYAAHLSREELASRASLSPDLVQSLERGRTANPRLSTLLGLASALGVTVGELVEEATAGLVDGDPTTEQAGKLLPILE